MSLWFVPYAPDVEIDEPRFDENVQTVIQRMERYITDSVAAEGTGQAVRDAHAKGGQYLFMPGIRALNWLAELET